ncbi:MAG: hypothetical protein IIT32_06455, partial [Bacteroidales bacterium]|nr:hypothetical protein [Bacteroidales bacterium]
MQKEYKEDVKKMLDFVIEKKRGRVSPRKIVMWNQILFFPFFSFRSYCSHSCCGVAVGVFDG